MEVPAFHVGRKWKAQMTHHWLNRHKMTLRARHAAQLPNQNFSSFILPKCQKVFLRGSTKPFHNQFPPNWDASRKQWAQKKTMKARRKATQDSSQAAKEINLRCSKSRFFNHYHIIKGVISYVKKNMKKKKQSREQHHRRVFANQHVFFSLTTGFCKTSAEQHNAPRFFTGRWCAHIVAHANQMAKDIVTGLKICGPLKHGR